MFEFHTAERTSFRARLSRGCLAHAVGDKVEVGRTHETHAVRARCPLQPDVRFRGQSGTSQFDRLLLTQIIAETRCSKHLNA